MDLHLKPLITVAAITTIGLVSLFLGQDLLAAAAGGALFSYLGRMNGQAPAST